LADIGSAFDDAAARSGIAVGDLDRSIEVATVTFRR